MVEIFKDFLVFSQSFGNFMQKIIKVLRNFLKICESLGFSREFIKLFNQNLVQKLYSKTLIFNIHSPPPNLNCPHESLSSKSSNSTNFLTQNISNSIFNFLLQSNQ